MWPAAVAWTTEVFLGHLIQKMNVCHPGHLFVQTQPVWGQDLLKLQPVICYPESWPGMTIMCAALGQHRDLALSPASRASIMNNSSSSSTEGQRIAAVPKQMAMGCGEPY